MTSNTSSGHRTVQRRAEVWRLRTEDGLSQQAIAALVGASQATVSRDLDFVAHQVAGDLKKVAVREKAIQIHQLQTIVREAISAWHDSKKPMKEIRKDSQTELMDVPVEGDAGGSFLPGASVTEKKLITVSEKIVTRVIEKGGSTAYLRSALDAMKALRDLLGLEEPKTINVNWKQELEQMGVDPSELFESMVQVAYDQLTEDNDAAGNALSE